MYRFYSCQICCDLRVIAIICSSIFFLRSKFDLPTIINLKGYHLSLTYYTFRAENFAHPF